MDALAICYRFGEGVEANKAEANVWRMRLQQAEALAEANV